MKNISNNPANTVTVSVRALAEFILRSGDIDSAYMSASRALEGTRVHQHVQKLRKEEAKADGAAYEREVSVDLTVEYKEINFTLKGRADGIRKEADGTVTVEEIKSTLAPPETIADDPSHWHRAQANCYGYMYLAAHEDEREKGIRVALTYCQVETNRQRTFTREMSFEALEEFFFGLLETYYAFARMDLDRLSERNATAKALAFPFGEYRKGQRELAVAVFAAVKQNKKLFAQAPTGIGKTISTLFPAVKAMAEGFGEKCFYLTAKAVARKVAEEAMQKMTNAGLRMRAVTLTAKDKICFQRRASTDGQAPAGRPRCNPAFCRCADGHFDRVNEAILELVKSELIITREVVEAYAEKHNVCPMELQLDAALFCDIIICDYNHAYDPKAKLKRFFANGAAGDYILLNDEAHNLVDRARDMFSAGLYRKDFRALKKSLGETLGKKHALYKAAGAVEKEIKNCWEKSKTEPGILELSVEEVATQTMTSPEAVMQTMAVRETVTAIEAVPDNQTFTHGKAFIPEQPFTREQHSADLSDALFMFALSCDGFLKSNSDSNTAGSGVASSSAATDIGANASSGIEEELLSAYFTALDYMRVTEAFDERYTFFCDPGSGHVKLFCLDPSFQLREAQKKIRACVFFSATLTPLGYFRTLLGGEAHDFTLRLASPFPRENLCLLIDTSVSTRYKHRAGSYGKISDALHAMISAKTGNYLAFFPSYAYLNEVRKVFAESFPHVRVMIQETEMPDGEREKYLEAFTDSPSETLLAFAVLGGAFSEGIDLKGERLTGAAVVGVGLPLICAERNILSDYFNRTGAAGDGFDFAYRFPGMNKVLQAAGRVIRTETDRGVVCLMDDRLGENAYRELFPQEWYGYARVRGAENMTEHLNNFWEGKNKP